MSRSRLTTSIVRRATQSPSSSVLNRWRLNRIDEWASSELAPSAAITYEGSRVADVHDEPDDRAVSLWSPIRTDSLSTWANDMFRLCGILRYGSLFRNA